MEIDVSPYLGYLTAICTGYKRRAERLDLEFDELLSEASISAIKALQSYSENLPHMSAATTWIYAWVNRDLRRFLDREDKVRRHELHLDPHPDEEDEDIRHNPEEIVELYGFMEEFELMFSSIQLQVIEMTFAEGLSPSEIARKFNCSRQAIHNILARIEKIFQSEVDK